MPPAIVPAPALFDMLYTDAWNAPSSMSPQLLTVPLNAPPLITPLASLRTAKPYVCDASTNAPSSMTPLFRSGFSLET